MSAEPWFAELESSPIEWLLEPENPAARAMALEQLLRYDVDDDDVMDARSEAMTVDPIAGILAAQDGRGWWVNAGPGYSPKYTGTVWNVMLLAQLGADPADDRVQRACDHVMTYTATSAGGFGCSEVAAQRRSTVRLGAVKALRGLAAIPESRRTDREQRAVRAGIDFLLSTDPQRQAAQRGCRRTQRPATAKPQPVDPSSATRHLVGRPASRRRPTTAGRQSAPTKPRLPFSSTGQPIAGGTLSIRRGSTDVRRRGDRE